MCRRRPGRGLNQVADQTAEGEHKAWGAGQGGRGAVDWRGLNRGVVVWTGDTGGDDGGVLDHGRDCGRTADS
jgi:hypothetical protein